MRTAIKISEVCSTRCCKLEFLILGIKLEPIYKQSFPKMMKMMKISNFFDIHRINQESFQNRKTNAKNNLLLIFSFQMIEFMKIWRSSDFTPKRREIEIPGIRNLKFSMLTHVCGVVRGPLGSHYMVRSTLCVHLPWGSLRPIFNFCNLGYRKLSWSWILGFVSSWCLLYVKKLRFEGSYKNQWSMMYKMLQTRILDSR